MSRQYAYRIDLWMYSGLRYTHYIKASNERDAFDKAHKFANPLAQLSHDGVQFIIPKRLTKQYCIDHNIIMEEA